MTDIDIDAIRQREQAATEGPWIAANPRDDDSDWANDWGDPMVVTADSNPGNYAAIAKDIIQGPTDGAADAEFIAHARTDIPALLDLLATAEQDVRDRYEQIARLERHIAGLETQCNEQMHAPAAERDALKALLDMPCGSCHPCTNYADETWRAAGRKPPHVFEYDELLAEVKALRPVADAAAAWRRFTGDDSVRFSEETALIAAVDALPNLQEPCDICSSTAGGCPECREDARAVTA